MATAIAGTGVFSASGAATPFNGVPHRIPGRIEVEEYDTDGAGWAYRDTTTGNEGGVFRSDDVDIEEGGDNYNVGWRTQASGSTTPRRPNRRARTRSLLTSPPTMAEERLRSSRISAI